MSRTKIVATYGPACSGEDTIHAMLEAGLDVFRLNVSHLEPRDLAATARRLLNLALDADWPLGILADMPGPKIRCTRCEPEAFHLAEGACIELAPGDGVSTPDRLYISYDYLLEDVYAGHELAINDGLVLLYTDKVDQQAGVLRCRVLRGGPVSSRKGVSFLHSSLRIAGLTDRDREGLRAAAESPVDFVALSFVRSAEDIHAARELLKEHGRGDLALIAKIEQHEAVDNIEEIIAASDGVMVARGDMGIERPLEEVPILQKRIISRANQTGKFVITATQMLESMTTQSRPTRAEVTDVANAILDGTDAVMLSAETAMGHDPALVVRTMTRIAVRAETMIDHHERLDLYHPGRRAGDAPPAAPTQGALDEALAHAACQLAETARLDALVCLSFYGSTGRRVSRYRPHCPIMVLSPYQEQCRRLALTWGVELFPLPEAHPDNYDEAPTPEQLLRPIVDRLLEAGRLKKGQRIGVLAGLPLDTPGATNWLRVVEV